MRQRVVAANGPGSHANAPRSRNTTEVDHLGYRRLLPAECLGLLRREGVGRLALVVSGAPEIFPVNYVVDGSEVVFRSGGGTKLDALRDGTPVAFEVDGTEALGSIAWSVIVKGRSRLVVDHDEWLRLRELGLCPWHGAAKPHIVRIEQGTVSGRRFAIERQPRMRDLLWERRDDA